MHANVGDECFRRSSDVSEVRYSGTLPVVGKRRETQVRSRRDGADGRRLRQQASGASAGLEGQASKLQLQRTVTEPQAFARVCTSREFKMDCWLHCRRRVCAYSRLSNQMREGGGGRGVCSVLLSLSLSLSPKHAGYSSRRPHQVPLLSGN